jgi:hypothetical protein
MFHLQDGDLKSLSSICLIFIAAAATSKVAYYFWLENNPSGNTRDAFALGTDQVQPLDSVHSSEKLTTREFSFRLAKKLPFSLAH